jgi:hypothetical protein
VVADADDAAADDVGTEAAAMHERTQQRLPGQVGQVLARLT